MNDEHALRAEMTRIGQWLYGRGLIAGGDGNMSVRLDGDSLLTTPAGVCKGMLAPEQLVVVDMDGQPRDPAQTPSSELKLHLAVYRARPDVAAVVHAHPPVAVACTLAGIPLNAAVLPELLLSLGEVPTAPYALTGTWELAEAVAPLLARDAFLLAHHGAVTMGKNVLEAFLRMEQVEHSAKIIAMAHQLGGAQPLPEHRLEELRALRQRIVAHE